MASGGCLSVVLLGALISCGQALPPPGYIGKSTADVEEVTTAGRRSLTEPRKFHVQYDHKSVELNLMPSTGLLPKVLKMTAIGTGEDGLETVEEWTHTTGEGSEVYVDASNAVSVIIDDMNGPPQMRGRVASDLVIEPKQLSDGSNETATTGHVVYRVRPTPLPPGGIQLDDALLTQAMSDVGKTRDKRQQVSRIYVPLYIVINYEYYALMGSDVSAVVAYVKTFFASVNSYFALIPQPKVQISISAIDVYKTASAASLIERHRHTDGGLVAGEVLKEYRTWAFTNRASLGSAAGVYIMTGTKYMCTVPHGNSKELCKDIGGLTVESAACAGYGTPFSGITYRVAISLDDYAYSGIPAATHEVGHMLGMSHDGSKPTYDANAPSAQSCPWTTFNIMGQPNYVKVHTKWSSCSIRQLQFWAQSRHSGCVKQPPTTNPYPYGNTLTVHNVNRQCQIRHGASAIFPSFCQNAKTKNDEICYKLMCFDNTKQACQFGYGAAPGTPCGPSGEICYQGVCQSRSNLGISQQQQAGTGGIPTNQGGCVDKQITLAGLSCSDWLSRNLGACNHATITTNCCASRARLCQGGAAATQRPIVSGGCVDKQITLAGLSCSDWLSRNLGACNHASITTNCCASRARLCQGGAAATQRPIVSGGCVDKQITLAGLSCSDWLSRNLGACNHATITTNCCASRARLCQGGAAATQRPVVSGGCTDNPMVKFGNGQSCAQYLSGEGRNFACSWPVVAQSCCASKARYCTSNSVVG